MMDEPHITTKARSAIAISIRAVNVALEDLDYDATSPRIVKSLGPNASQTEIESMLLQGDLKTLELIPSFIESGYIPYEPLIVKPSGSKYVVVEGNRRLAALRSMQKSDDPEEQAAFAHHHLETVPCLVFEGDERQLLAYLGLRHLSKTKDWSSSAKGAFVERILRAGHELSEAARLTNTSTPALRQILLTRRLFERAAELRLVAPANEAEGETYFWRLGDAIRRTKTKSYLELMENPDPLEGPEFDEAKFENLIGWIYGNPKTGQLPVITSIRDTKTLDTCLGNPRATRQLENGATLNEAAEELEAAGATVLSHLERAKKSVERANGGDFSEIDENGLNQIEAAVNSLVEATDSTRAILRARRDRLSK